MTNIEPYQAADHSEVVEFVLGIQNIEYRLNFALQEQPDLVDIATFYHRGQFWVAKQDCEIVGTIGLQVLDSTNGILRKLFVKKALRGKDPHIAALLLDRLTQHAYALHLAYLWLDTPEVARASHRFYEKNGFERMRAQDCPTGYYYPNRDSRIYRLAL